MTPDTSLPSDQDLQRLVVPSDERPSFIAEGLSPHFRLGLLLATLLTDVGLFVIVIAAALHPGSLLRSGLFGVLLGAATVTIAFALLLVFGTVIGNNPRLSTGQRTGWFIAILLAGPVMVPVYWLMHLRSAPFDPAH